MKYKCQFRQTKDPKKKGRPLFLLGVQYIEMIGAWGSNPEKDI